MNIDALLQQAPAIPDYQAEFQAIYFEPISHSGERFAIAIAAQSQSEYKVIHTIQPKLIKCMFGEHYESMNGFINIITNNLDLYLKSNNPLSSWIPPIQGVYKSDLISTHSAKGMDGVVFQALTTFSSLYRGNAINDIADEILERENENNAESESTRIITSVRALLVAKNEQFSKRFNQKIKTSNGGSVSIDYAGVHYNANISNFNVKSISHAEIYAKAKLHELDVLREDRARNNMNLKQEYELMVYIDESSDQAQNSFQNIEKQGDTVGLRVRKVSSPENAVETIVSHEKVA